MTQRLVVARRADDDLMQILAQIKGEAGWRIAQDYGQRFVSLYELILEQPEIYARRRRSPYLLVCGHFPARGDTGQKVMLGDLPVSCAAVIASAAKQSISPHVSL